MRVLIAPNAFKNSLDAQAVAEAVQEGLRQSRLECSTECFPIGDGGDGTASLMLTRLRGEVISTQASDPLGRPIKTSFGLVDEGKTAVIEMADASGLRLLKSHELNPLRASSGGTGELIIQALNYGVKKVIVGMGGSATVDAGTGILKALGVRFLNAKGEELASMPESLRELELIDISDVDRRIQNCEVVVLCDVDNQLLGEKGAAAMFGPQKGASPDGVYKLEAALSKFTEVVLRQTRKNLASLKYGGTAGGAAAGLHALLNATLVNGIDYFLDQTGFDEALAHSDILITAEGSIDEQTLQGKGPFGVAARAKSKGIPVIGLAGRVPLHPNKSLQEYFDVLLPIGNEPTDISEAMRLTAENIVRTGIQIGNLLALKAGKVK